MISTVAIKQQQLSKGFFTIGSGSEVILVMGSCRVVNFVTYLDEWNKANNNRFTIHSLDPFNWNWNENDDRVEYMEAINKLESDERILEMISSVDIFIHEYYANYGMFNCSKDAEKNIYKFGMNPKIDVCLPSFNNHFILFADILAFDVELRKKAIQDFNVLDKLSPQTEVEIYKISQQAIGKFYEVCGKSDLPEMGEYFQKNFRLLRLWWSYNHTTKNFTLAVFKLLNDKFLHLDLTKGFDKLHEDIFANNFTPLTDYDEKIYNYTWEELIVPLRSKL